MLNLTPDMKASAEYSYNDYRKSAPKSALNYDKFLVEFLGHLGKKSKISYPYVVRVAKPIDKLISGDFTPDYEIEVNSPIMYNGQEIWTGDTSKELELHLGYLNGDKRYFSDYVLDGIDSPHGFLGGSTGSGKSVALNQLLFNMFFEYAPWKLDVTMSDAKIVEFKAYGLQHHIPHIHSISATEDGGYLVSVLEKFESDMKKLNDVFTQVNAKNLKEFKEATRLEVPRHLLVMDEVTAMFKGLSAEKSKRVLEILDNIGALGRNTGFNLILASQQIDDKVTSFIQHLPVRMCLKCNTTAVSEKLIGNDQGAVGDVGVGKIIVNNNTASGSKDDNTKLRVPYQDPQTFLDQGKSLEEIGNKIGYRSYYSFYDEQDKLFEDKLGRVCESKSSTLSLVIGEPSFVSRTPEKLEIILSPDDISNVLVYAPLAVDLHRYFRTMYINAKFDRSRGVSHRFIVADKNIFSAGSEFSLEDLDPIKDEFYCSKLNGIDSRDWEGLVKQTYSKMVIVEADDLVFPKLESSEESTEYYKEAFGEDPKTNITKSRAYHIKSILESANYENAFGLKQLAGSSKEATRMQLFRLIFNTIKALGSNFIETRITTESLPKTVYHLVGVHKINGMGRDASGTQTSSVKKLFMDSNKSNVFFIAYTSNIEYFGDTIAGFQYVISDKISNPSRIKCNDYPQKVRSVCGVLSYVNGDNLMSFKRLSLGISD